MNEETLMDVVERRLARAEDEAAYLHGVLLTIAGLIGEDGKISPAAQERIGRLVRTALEERT